MAELRVQGRRLVGVVHDARVLGVLTRVAEVAVAVDEVDFHVADEGSAVGLLADAEVPDVDAGTPAGNAVADGQDVLPDPVGRVALVEGVALDGEPGLALVVEEKVTLRPVDLDEDRHLHRVHGRGGLLGVFFDRLLLVRGAGVVVRAVGLFGVVTLDIGVVGVTRPMLRCSIGLGLLLRSQLGRQAARGVEGEEKQSRTEKAHRVLHRQAHR